MFITKKHLSRRTFLQAAGASLALPFLESMVPAMMAQAPTNSGTRLGFIYIPHGAIMDRWTPKTEGADFEFTPILKPLEPFRDSMVVVSCLQRAEVNSNHAVSSGCWLTGTPPKRTDGPDFEVGTSVDQVIAKRIGQDTTFPSLEVATEDFSGLVGACDPGYSCAYMNTLNWQTPTTPLPMEINPRVVFERLFGGGGTLEQRLSRMRTDRSLLDFIADDLKHIEGGLPTRDRARPPVHAASATAHTAAPATTLSRSPLESATCSSPKRGSRRDDAPPVRLICVRCCHAKTLRASATLGVVTTSP